MSLGGLVFAFAPRDLFHDHAALAAVDAPHGIQEENQKPPERNELEPPLGEMIVARCRFPAPRADGRGTFAWPDSNFDSRLDINDSSILLNKTLKVIALV